MLRKLYQVARRNWAQWRRPVLAVPESSPCPAGAHCAGEPTNILIGANVHFGGNVLLYANAPITIGHDTIVAVNTIIHTSTHDYHDHPVWCQRIDRPVQIGCHVWIGTGAIILPGVIVGDYAVVGAGSVVTANVPEGAIVAGNPARIIKYRAPETYQQAPAITQVQEGRVHKAGFLSHSCKDSAQHPRNCDV